MIDPRHYTPSQQPFISLEEDGQTDQFQLNLSSSIEIRPEDSHLYDDPNDLVSMDTVEEKSLTAESVSVNVVSMHSLFVNCFPIIAKSAKSPEHALETMKTIKISTDKCGYLPLFTEIIDGSEEVDNAYSQLWVEVPKSFASTEESFYLNFKIERGPFYSQFLPDSTSAESFNYLSIYEDEELKPFIYLRLGDRGEILWLSKGNKINGSKVKDVCLKMLESIPLNSTSYLLDAAKINLRIQGRSSQKVVEIFLSVLLSISSDNGESWYGRSGFHPLKCENLKIKGGVVSQDPDLYYQAVEKLRSIRFSELKVLFGKYRQRIKFLTSWIGEEKNPTLHEISKKAHAQTRLYQKGSQGAIEAETRLFNLYHYFLDAGNLKVPATSKKFNLYFLALETLKVHTIWQRGFTVDAINTSYYRFTLFPHKSFDERMTLIATKRPFKWQLPNS